MALKRVLAIGVAVVAVIVLSASVYTVDQTEQAVVFQLGQAVRAEREAGLKFKLPFVQNVAYYDNRVLNVDPPSEQVSLLDQRRLDVDAFTRYRIVDPLNFFRTMGDEANMSANLSRITNSALRDVLGTVTQADLLSKERGEIMERIRDSVADATQRYGIEVLDVRIVRTDVPESTVQSVYNRMRSEREREAAEARAQGEELSQQIRSRADRDRTVLLAEAERDAQILRGQGDAEATEILSAAFDADPQFYAFYRSLEAYRESMAGKDTTFVLAPRGEFFRFFADPAGNGLPLPPAPDAGATVGPLPPVPPVTALPDTSMIEDDDTGVDDPAADLAEPEAATPAEPAVPAEEGAPATDAAGPAAPADSDAGSATPAP
jgi:membrane protease subunit HflC